MICSIKYKYFVSKNEYELIRTALYIIQKHIQYMVRAVPYGYVHESFNILHTMWTEK